MIRVLKTFVYICFFIWLMGVGLHLTMQKAKASEYATATSAHIIKETISGNIDHNKVMSAELERLIHKFAIRCLPSNSQATPHGAID